MTTDNRIGFMQGRLSPLVDGKIQAFPWDDWEGEFAAARTLGIRLMEWTLDHDRLAENPLMTTAGRTRIKALCAEFDVAIPSLTGDLFMQAPFYKADGAERTRLLDDMMSVMEACAELNIVFIVMPLVDDGRLENRQQEDGLIEELLRVTPFLAKSGLKIVFESDYQPPELARFIKRLDPACFGINLDTGNSAALGIALEDEMAHYGERILNVHIKDRLYQGTTVPLGQGVARLVEAVAALEKSGYAGNYILQTARAEDGDHAGVLGEYRNMLAEWIAH